MKKSTLAILLVTMAALFGFCDGAQAVRVKFVFPESYKLHIYTTQTTTFYDADGNMTGGGGVEQDVKDLESSDWIELDGPFEYVQRNLYLFDLAGQTGFYNDSTVTIYNDDGSGYVVKYKYSWAYTRSGGGNTFEGGDITKQVVDSATIDLTKYFPAECIVTVNIIDTDGTPQDDIEVKLSRLSSGSYQDYDNRRTVNGKAVFDVTEGEYVIDVIRDGRNYASEKFTVSGEGTGTGTVTITIPKMISLIVNIIDEDGTPQDDIKVKLSSDSYYPYYEHYDYYESTENGKAVFTIPEGKYDIEVSEDYHKYLEVGIEVSEDMTVTYTIPKIISLTVNIVDTEGTPQDDIYVRLKGLDYYDHWTKNGKAVFDIPEGKYLVKIENNENYTIAVSEDTTVTYTVPKMISFDVTIDGVTLAQILDNKGYSGLKDAIEFFTLDYQDLDVKYKEGKLYGRFDPNKEYLMISELFGVEDTGGDFIKGSTKITDGCTIRIGTFNVQTEGEGLAFPREEFAGNSSYKVFVGNPVRLAAVPVGDNKFVSWTINGKEYANQMMDFTVKDDITTATAKFSGEILTQVKAADSSIETISVQVEGNYLVLPSDVEATASMYSADGRLVKRTGVVGNKINISDLPASAYILRLNAEGLFQTAQFVKK
ncbi:MAG: T9SS type A sorting domain-containing protein [Bacteroidaceae bacterium]|nr:T9SS type A sorting domain-containing protein [Bacteroidaceae bacterium]